MCSNSVQILVSPSQRRHSERFQGASFTVHDRPTVSRQASSPSGPNHPMRLCGTVQDGRHGCGLHHLEDIKPTSANYSWSLHELPSSLFDLVPAMRSSPRDGHLMEQRRHWFLLHVGESANTLTWFRDGLQNIRVGRLKIRCVVCNVKHQEEFRRLSSCVLPRPLSIRIVGLMILPSGGQWGDLVTTWVARNYPCSSSPVPKTSVPIPRHQHLGKNQMQGSPAILCTLQNTLAY